jgi:RNA recognition motif-containing protein
MKALICGDVSSEFELVTKRLATLQSSAHGPFDVVFCCGPFFKDEAECIAVLADGKLDLAIPVYVLDKSGFVEKTLSVHNVPNLFPLGAAGLINVAGFTVAFISTETNASDHESVRRIASGPNYQGCDFLLSDDWPRDLHHFLEGSDLEDLRANGVGLGVGNQAIADLTGVVKPRYHFASGRGCFYQRPPYRSVGGGPVTRFVALSPVSELKGKSKKWLHALSIEPISRMSDTDIFNVPAGSTPNPFVDVLSSNSSSYMPNKKARTAAFVAPGGFVEASQPQHEQEQNFFFGDRGKSRQPLKLQPSRPDARSLFLGNIPFDATEQELIAMFPNAVECRHPDGKPFAFLKCRTHENAKWIVDKANAASQPTVYTIRGRNLSVAWGNDKEDRKGTTVAPVYVDTFPSSTTATRDIGEPPYPGCSTVYVGSLPQLVAFASEDCSTEDGQFEARQSALKAIFPDAMNISGFCDKSFAFVDFTSHESAKETLDHFKTKPASLLGQPLKLYWGSSKKESKTSNCLADSQQHQNQQRVCLVNPGGDCRTLFLSGIPADATAAQLQAVLQCSGEVRRPKGRSYAFAEFSSNAEAGDVLERSQQGHISMNGHILTLGWAQGKPAPSVFNTATNCWFCLGSPDVKQHLVVSIAEHSYVALPKGGVHPFHCMIIPIECIPSQLHMSSSCRQEFERFKTGVGQLFEKNGFAMLSFERAVRSSKGRDHMQVHLVPIDRNDVAGSQDTFLELCGKHNLSFRDVTESAVEGQGVSEIILGLEGGPYQEYCYIELPTGIAACGEEQWSITMRKYVFVVEQGSGVNFFMPFGLHLAGTISRAPEKVMWKTNALNDEEEEQMVDVFRNAFEPFDFSLIL